MNRNKEVTFLISFLLLFGIFFLKSVIDLRRGVPILGLGIEYQKENWIIIILTAVATMMTTAMMLPMNHQLIPASGVGSGTGVVGAGVVGAVVVGAGVVGAVVVGTGVVGADVVGAGVVGAGVVGAGVVGAGVVGAGVVGAGVVGAGVTFGILSTANTVK